MVCKTTQEVKLIYLGGLLNASLHIMTVRANTSSFEYMRGYTLLCVFSIIV